MACFSGSAATSSVITSASLNKSPYPTKCSALGPYWQQHYHTEAPWSAWQGKPLWDFRARLYRATDNAQQTFVSEWSEVKEDMTLTYSPAILPNTVFPKGFLKGSRLSTWGELSNEPVILDPPPVRTPGFSARRQSTGLRYPAFFNWPKTLEDTLTQYPRIAVVVVFLGPNNPWGLPAEKENQTPTSPFKSERWEVRYHARIADILHIA